MKRRNAPIVPRWAAAGLLAALLAGPAQAAPETAPPVIVRPAQGEAVSGALAGLDATSVTVTTAGGSRTLPLADVRTIEVQTALEPMLASRPHLHIVLVGGEVIDGLFAKAATDSLTVASPDLGTRTFLLETIATVVSVPADAGPCFHPEFLNRPGEDDVAYVHSGDAYAGIVLSASDEGLEIETERGRTRKVSWDDLLVLHLNNDVPPAPEGLVVEVETVEGSRIRAAGPVVLADGALQLAPRSAPRLALSVPLEHVRVLRMSGGSFVYASDLPFESEYVDYYADTEMEREYQEDYYGARADRRSSGCPLRLGGKTYRHGFGVQSRSLVTLHPAGAWKRFEALFGVDDEAVTVDGAPGGMVDARVLGDGKVLWEARGVRGGQAPRPVGPLDVSGVQVLVLEVDFGADFGVAGDTSDTSTRILDRATWADPLLFR